MNRLEKSNAVEVVKEVLDGLSQNELISMMMYLNPALENLPEGVLITSMEGRVVLHNKKLGKLFPSIRDAVNLSEVPWLQSRFPDMDCDISVPSVIRHPDGQYFSVTRCKWFTPIIPKEEFWMLRFQPIGNVEAILLRKTEISKICEALCDKKQLMEQTYKQREHYFRDGLHWIARTLGLENFEFWKFDIVEQWLRLHAQSGSKEVCGTLLNADAHQIRWVYRHKRLDLCKDASLDPHFPKGTPPFSAIAVPVIFRDEMYGVFYVRKEQVNAFDEVEIACIEHLTYELARMMNILMLLCEEKMDILDELHKQLTVPLNRLKGFVQENRHDGAEKAVIDLCDDIEAVRNAICSFGKNLPQQLFEDFEELVPRWFKVFKDKNILWLENDNINARWGNSLFTTLGAMVVFQKTGKDTLAALASMKPDVLIAIEKPDDYEHGTQFFVDLASVYKEKHPPLLILQNNMERNDNHVFSNTRVRYPYAQQVQHILPVGKLDEMHHWLERVQNAILKAEGKEGNFTVVLDSMNDPWRSDLGNAQRKAGKFSENKK
ncbi:MAG: GAF domain-containing protein [Planctomycetaceae bacterium]|nr:GAF domain-containing protein [Planctomycetaceae bacterium]